MKKKRIFLWGLGGVILALTFSNNSSFADLSGSKMSGCYDLSKSTACFEIINKSSDSENITSVQLEFAEGWKLQCGDLSGADSCENATNFTCTIPEDNICSLGG
jgi:hypothetical protein